MGKAKKIKLFKVLLILLLLALIASIVIPIVYRTIEGTRVVQHKALYRDLDDYVKNHGDAPDSLEEVLKLHDSKVSDEYLLSNISYHPENWLKENAIVLESKVGRKLIITYSDGKTFLIY